tara:strand:+ start:37776 stop:37952 length:177 start_codon:yes stop_codon:yes gene_type:complete
MNKEHSKYELQTMTVNERLFATGLINEFDKVKKKDRVRAKEILQQVYVDSKSIDQILK